MTEHGRHTQEGFTKKRKPDSFTDLGLPVVNHPPLAKT